MDIVNQETSSRASLLDASFVRGPTDNVHGCMSLNSFGCCMHGNLRRTSCSKQEINSFAHLKFLDERQLGFLGR